MNIISKSKVGHLYNALYMTQISKAPNGDHSLPATHIFVVHWCNGYYYYYYYYK